MPLIPEPAGLPDGFPSAWRGAALSAWEPAGHVPQAQAWLELDLDAELSFQSSLLVVAGQQLWWVPQEGGSPKAKSWMLQQGMDAPRCKVGIMGITFKENCPDIRNSKVVDMVREFETWGANVVVADPWADPQEVQHEYGITLGQINAHQPVDALVVAVGHHEYRNATPAELRQFCRSPQPVLADVKSLFCRHTAAAQGFTVFRL